MRWSFEIHPKFKLNRSSDLECIRDVYDRQDWHEIVACMHLAWFDLPTLCHGITEWRANILWESLDLIWHGTRIRCKESDLDICCSWCLRANFFLKSDQPSFIKIRKCLPNLNTNYSLYLMAWIARNTHISNLYFSLSQYLTPFYTLSSVFPLQP